jgi:hypothetical protein
MPCQDDREPGQTGVGRVPDRTPGPLETRQELFEMSPVFSQGTEPRSAALLQQNLCMPGVAGPPQPLLDYCAAHMVEISPEMSPSDFSNAPMLHAFQKAQVIVIQGEIKLPFVGAVGGCGTIEGVLRYLHWCVCSSNLPASRRP